MVPQSARSGPDGRHGGTPRLRVRSAPEEGKANEEVERVLSRELGAGARVVRGARGRRKIVEVDLPPAALEARLRRSFGPH